MIITTLSDTTGKYAEGEENRSSPQGRAEKAAADSENVDGDRRKQELQKAQLPGNTGWLCLVFSVRFHPLSDRLYKDRNYNKGCQILRISINHLLLIFKQRKEEEEIGYG